MRTASLTRGLFAAAATTPGSSGLTYTYFGLAGRGELSRLVAAAGGLTIEDRRPPEQGHRAYAAELGLTLGKVPILEHGDLKLCQSSAIETYLGDIAPRFADLTPRQKAVDNMFAAVKAEALDVLNPYVFTAANRPKAPAECPALLDRYYGFFERQIPDGDFVLGLGFPTKADLVVLQAADAFAPFGAVRLLIDQDYDVAAKWPKVRRVADVTAKAPGVREYLEQSTTFYADPVGLRGAKT